MLRLKEIEERIQREKEEERKRMGFKQKYDLQSQMQYKEQLKREAYEEYIKERD